VHSQQPRANGQQDAAAGIDAGRIARELLTVCAEGDQAAAKLNDAALDCKCIADLLAEGVEAELVSLELQTTATIIERQLLRIRRHLHTVKRHRQRLAEGSVDDV